MDCGSSLLKFAQRFFKGGPARHKTPLILLVIPYSTVDMIPPSQAGEVELRARLVVVSSSRVCLDFQGGKLAYMAEISRRCRVYGSTESSIRSKTTRSA